MILNIEFFQVKEDNSLSKCIKSDTTTEEIKKYIKESGFSYIGPVHVSTRLIVYHSSNVTSMEGQVHRGAKAIVEVPEGCMILFTNNTFHVGVKIYAKYGGNYLSHLRLFAYIVEDKYTSIEDSIETISKAIECEKDYTICESLRNDNIHYEGHIIKYLKTQCDTDNLNMSSVLLRDLETVGWIVLKWVYEITNGSEQQEYFYHLNNHSFQKKMKYWNT